MDLESYTVIYFISLISSVWEKGSSRPLIPFALNASMFNIVGNWKIFFAVQLDACLHNPMYILYQHLLLPGDLAPQTILMMLSNLVSKEKTISFIGCLLQMYFFHSLGGLKPWSSQWWPLIGMLPSATPSAASHYDPWLCIQPLLVQHLWASLCYCLRLCDFYFFHSVVPTKFINSSVTLNLRYTACTDISWFWLKTIHVVSILTCFIITLPI